MLTDSFHVKDLDPPLTISLQTSLWDDQRYYTEANIQQDSTRSWNTLTISQWETQTATEAACKIFNWPDQPADELTR